jgi:hypothetical protein
LFFLSLSSNEFKPLNIGCVINKLGAPTTDLPMLSV